VAVTGSVVSRAGLRDLDRAMSTGGDERTAGIPGEQGGAEQQMPAAARGKEPGKASRHRASAAEGGRQPGWTHES
jgi:hypothetical protein